MWYSKDIEDIYKELNVSKNGLSSENYKKRLYESGYNILPQKKQDSIFKLFFLQFFSPIIAILIIAIILSLIIGEYFNSIFILAVILINAILGTIQEFSAEKSAEKLQSMIKVASKVIRDGSQIEVDSSNLVVGDIVVLKSGDKIPADIRLIEANNFIVDESILTGESEGCIKDICTLPKDVSISDRKNMGYAGTIVLSGRSLGIVVETASNTEIGKIADKVMNTEDADSPLVIRINKFSKQLSIYFTIFALFMSFFLYFKGYLVKEIFFSVISLTVSAIPEGLSTAMTIALSISSSRMAKKNVIVKKLNSVESLGSCTVIATDKTGTLTANEQTAKIIMFPWSDQYYIKGTGYIPNPEIIFNETFSKTNIEHIHLISKLGVINNDASLDFINNTWKSSGDSIDIAFLTLGEKLHINQKSLSNYKIISKIPYESEKKFSAVHYNNLEMIQTIGLLRVLLKKF